MAVYKVRFSPEAALEVERAAEWYACRSVIAAEAFVNEIDAAITEVRQLPEAWPPYRHKYRRRVLSRFPFSLVYRINEHLIEIVAVVHDKKRPGYFEGPN